MSSRLPQITDSLSLVKEILQQLTSQRASIEEDIQSSFDDLHKQLDVRKSVLLMELEVTFGLKQKVIYQWNKMNLTCWLRLEVGPSSYYIFTCDMIKKKLSPLCIWTFISKMLDEVRYNLISISWLRLDRYPISILQQDSISWK